MVTDEDLVNKGFKPLHERVTDLNAPTKQGIDGVFEKDGKLYIVESKYGAGSLDNLADGTRQMDSNWVQDRERLKKLNVPESVKGRILNGEYTPVVAKISPAGEVRYTPLKNDGYVDRASKLEGF